MKIRYFVKKTKNKPTNIYCRVWVGRSFDKTAKTGIYVNYDDFSNAKQKLKQKADIKNKDTINNTLTDLRGYLIDKWNTDYIKNNIGDNWLKQAIQTYFNPDSTRKAREIYFIDWINDFISKADTRIYKGKQITHRTKQTYITLRNKLQAYEKHKGKRLKFKDITLKFYYDFINYCKAIEKLNNNTIGGYIKNIKLFARNIEFEGLPISKDYKHPEFMVLRNETKDVYLTDDEINRIYQHDFSNSVRLDNARDLFIIGLRTGLRVSDFMRLKDINIQEGFISIETKKTGNNVIIPLHPQIKAIYQKRNGLPYAISHQKFNEYIKEICKLVGIDELTEGAIINPKTKRKETGVYPKYKLITSHTARRSFASNLYGKLPNKVIMDITGHKTETQFLKYIKITKKENAETLRKYWAKEEKEKGYKNILQVVNKK